MCYVASENNQIVVNVNIGPSKSLFYTSFIIFYNKKILYLWFEERMAAYAQAQKRSKTDNRLSSCSGSSPYRNAFFYAISTDALAREFPDPSPTHTEYWEFARENGLLAD